MNKSKQTWIWVVGIIVVAALGLWWFASDMPLDTWTPFTNKPVATTTEQVAETPSKPTVNRVSRSNSDVVSIAKSLSGTSQFNALFTSTGVAATIGASSDSKYTIFVPTNGAFAQLAGGTIANMTAAEKLRLVQYHVVSGRAVEIDATIAGSIQALSGDALNFNYGTDKIPMVNSAIIVAEYTGKNGTVYLIDNVLLPPKKQNI